MTIFFLMIAFLFGASPVFAQVSITGTSGGDAVNLSLDGWALMDSLAGLPISLHPGAQGEIEEAMRNALIQASGQIGKDEVGINNTQELADAIAASNKAALCGDPLNSYSGILADGHHLMNGIWEFLEATSPQTRIIRINDLTEYNADGTDLYNPWGAAKDKFESFELPQFRGFYTENQAVPSDYQMDGENDNEAYSNRFLWSQQKFLKWFTSPTWPQNNPFGYQLTALPTGTNTHLEHALQLNDDVRYYKGISSPSFWSLPLPSIAGMNVSDYTFSFSSLANESWPQGVRGLLFCVFAACGIVAVMRIL